MSLFQQIRHLLVATGIGLAAVAGFLLFMITLKWTWPLLLIVGGLAFCLFIGVWILSMLGYDHYDF